MNGRSYWIKFEADYREDDRVLLDVTGFFKDSDEPWATSEWTQGSETRKLFETAEDYFLALGQYSNNLSPHRSIAFYGYYNDDWVLESVGVVYDADEEVDRVEADELLPEDMERPLADKARQYLVKFGDLQVEG